MQKKEQKEKRKNSRRLPSLIKRGKQNDGPGNYIYSWARW